VLPVLVHVGDVLALDVRDFVGERLGGVGVVEGVADSHRAGVYPRTMSNRAVAAGVGLARVLAHCGGSAEEAVHYLAGAIASAPQEPEPYAVLAELWRDKRSELAEVVQDAGSLKTVLAQSYISFLESKGIPPGRWTPVCSVMRRVSW
jgi:hypothetical protein